MATDFISREAAIKMRHACKKDCSTCDFAIEGDSWCQGELFVVDILRIPAADVRPVVRSRWKAHGDCGVTECPVCRWSIEECIDYNFCPNCGADMREPNLDTTKGGSHD